MLRYEHSLVLIHLISIKLYELVDTGARYLAIERVVLLELASIDRLIGSLQLNRNAWLALLAERNLHVVRLNGSSKHEGI